MPAKSKQQQKFFGVVRAMQKGDIPKKGEAGEVADDMKKMDVKKMASTKHKGLPRKIKEIILQEIVKELKLNEVKPFVDDKLRNQWDYPKGNKDGLVYLATNDRRYPTEIVIYNMNRDVFHFLHSQGGDWKKATQETVPRKGFNSTHWVMPYFEEWEEDFDYEKGFYEGKINEVDMDKVFMKGRTKSRFEDIPDEKDLSLINKARAKAALKQIKTGKRSDGLPGPFTARLFGVTPSGQVQQIIDPRDIEMYKKFGLAESKLNEAKGNNMYDDVITLKRSFDIFKQQSPDLYKQLDRKFKVKNIQKTLGDMIKFMDTPAAMREATLPKFKTPLEALKWVWGKRDEAMDMEQQLKDISSEIQQLYSEMEQDAEPEGGPISDQYADEIHKLEQQHKDLRSSYEQLMAEIDEYDQNYM
tara:strand:+ start:1913 stop:3154 length:1242 start_codon:yes stop_codon:yes gene_type:complete